MKPQLIVEQKITAFVNRYAVYATDEAGNKQAMVAFAQQKRLAFKERVNFYSDESKSRIVFSFRAEKVIDVHGKYIVEDESGTAIGAFKKQFKQSLLSSTWHILDVQDQTKLTIQESNITIALIRRFGGFIPFVGDGVDILISFFRYHFTFTDAGGVEVARYQKTKLFRDHYRLDMTNEAYHAEDWRILAAMAVALDALQSR